MGSRKWVIGSILLGIGVVIFGLVATPKVRIRSLGEGGGVRVVGREVMKVVKEAGVAAGQGVGLQGGDPCWRTPECEEKLKGKRSQYGGFPAEVVQRMTDEELACMDQCLPPGGYAGEFENLTVTLSDAQIAELVRQFLPETVKIQEVALQVKDGVITASAKSGYPPFAGVVTVEAVPNPETNWFRLRRAWLGQVPLPEQMVGWLDDGLDALITSTLADFYVSIEQGRLENNKFVLAIEVPKGLVKVDEREVVINFEVLRSLPIRPKAPWEIPGEEGGDLEIMPMIQ